MKIITTAGQISIPSHGKIQVNECPQLTRSRYSTTFSIIMTLQA
jgi:hypothetical protein